MSKTNKTFDSDLGRLNDSDIMSIYRQDAEMIPASITDDVLIPDFKGHKIDKYLLLLDYFGGGGGSRTVTSSLQLIDITSYF